MGKLWDDLDVEQLWEELVKGGMNMVKIRPLGDNLVLLTPRAGERMEDVIMLNKEWMDSFFDSVTPWSAAASNPSHKTVWVRCYGLPLAFWNRDCFSKVIGLMAPSATLKAVADSTMSWELLEYARIQVRILKLECAKMAKCVRVNNQLCNILIEEESPELYEGRHMDKYPSSESTDSVSLSETYIEETDLSVNNDEEVTGLWEVEGMVEDGRREREGEREGENGRR